MKKVCLLLADAFEAVEASVYTDVIGWNMTDGDGTTELITVGTKEKLKCTWNFTVIPEMLIEDLNVDEFDALAIPGGFEEMGFFEDAYSEPFLNVIREFHEKGKIISSICVAALSVAKSGVLVGKKGTTYNIGRKRQQQLAEMGVNLVPDQRIVEDGNIITSYNPSTAFDVAFDLLERLTSTENVQHIKKIMGFTE